MPAFLLPLLGKILPYLAGIIAAGAIYFGIKHKGAVAEREKIQAQQAKAVEAVKAKVTVAVEKDKVIDKAVGVKVDELKKHVQTEPAKTPDDFRPGDIFKF